MPPSEQERRCVEAVCRYLRETSGDEWRLAEWLDDGYADEPSPDVLLTDGTRTLAVEVKQLTDGEAFDGYDRAQQSLYERLAPNATGVYTLIPAPLVKLPLSPMLVSQLTIRIATAAIGLRVGDSARVAVPREATLRFVSQSDVGVVLCRHPQSDEVRAVSPEVAGVHFLDDDGPPHQFLSDESRLSFRRALTRASAESRRAGQATVSWFEEWDLLRHEDAVEGEGGVIVAAVVTDFLGSAAMEGVAKAISAARKKFEVKKWAARSAVALHAGEQQHQVSLSFYLDAITGLKAADVQPLQSVFLVGRTYVREFVLAT